MPRRGTPVPSINFTYAFIEWTYLYLAYFLFKYCVVHISHLVFPPSMINLPTQIFVFVHSQNTVCKLTKTSGFKQADFLYLLMANWS